MEADDLWQRAIQALRSAQALCQSDPDASASRSYYAAFYGVSALFAVEGKFFLKHSGIESAVHRDLVKAGRWPMERGADYSRLVSLRAIGDYGGSEHVTADQAGQAVRTASDILHAVREMHPDFDPSDW